MKSYKEFLGDAVKMIKIYNPLSITPKVINNVDVKNVISIGRYDTHKGYDYLIRAFKIVSEKYPDWKLRIVGDGYYKPKMEELISDLNLNDNVLLVPATKDVVKELNKASIYVMASRFEGYANALVEAMACGLSCISYDWLMGVDEIIKHNENGLIVNLTDRYRYFKTLDIIDEDINILADMIIKTIEDKNMREKFKDEAPKIVNSRKKDKIIEKCSHIAQVEGRMERIDCGQPYNVIVDFAHTPDGMEKMMQFGRNITMPGHRLIAVFGSAGKRDVHKRKVFGELADKYCDYIIVTEDDPRDEDPKEIADQIKSGIQNTLHVYVQDRYEAIHQAISSAQEGDTVLLLGKGDESFIYRENGRAPWVGDNVAAKECIQANLG